LLRYVSALLLAALVCGANPATVCGGLSPASLRDAPLGAPVALRTERILDRATLTAWGVGRPTRLAYDGEGALYILDVQSRRVVKLDADGRLLHSVGGYGDDPASLALPEDLAVDRRESLLVLDRARGAVTAYDKTGAFLTSQELGGDLHEDARVSGARLLLDTFGRLWLLNPRDRDLVPLDERLKRDRTGRFLTPEDSLRAPALAAALPGGDGWIYDEDAAVLRRFRSSGALGAATTPSDSGSESRVTGLAVDRAGFLFAADVEGQRILVFDLGGTRRLARVLGGPASPWRPSAIAWSRLDRIAIADPHRGEVQVLAVERGGTP
jgi:sugar lactone lactonase YvrE